MNGLYGSSILTEEFDFKLEQSMFLEIFDDEMSPQEVQERLESISNSCKYLTEEYGLDILNEAANPKEALSKLLSSIGSSSSTIFNAISGCAKGVAKEIKSNGIGKKSIAGIQDQFNKLSEECSKAIYTDKLDDWLKEFAEKHNIKYDISKLRKAFGALLKILTINTLCITLLSILVGPVGQYAVIWVIAPLIEENAKQKAIKGGYEKEFLVLFNAYEMTSYVLNLTKSGISFKGAVILRLKTAIMHVTTTIIQKVMQSKPVMKLLKLDPDKEEDKKNAAFIGKIAGLVLHGAWNIVGSTDNKLGDKLKGKEINKWETKQRDAAARAYGYDNYQQMKAASKRK
jgi:hypothetical protein